MLLLLLFLSLQLKLILIMFTKILLLFLSLLLILILLFMIWSLFFLSLLLQKVLSLWKMYHPRKSCQISLSILIVSEGNTSTLFGSVLLQLSHNMRKIILRTLLYQNFLHQKFLAFCSKQRKHPFQDPFWRFQL